MAVFFDAAGPGAYTENAWTDTVTATTRHTANGGNIAILAALAFSATDINLWPFIVSNNDLTALTRTVTYNGTPMASLGAAPWGTAHAWTELFVAIGVPAGQAEVKATVHGGVATARAARLATVSYTGVDSIGTPVTGTGTGTNMSISATAGLADRLVAVYATRSGIAALPGATHYVANAGIALGVGDNPGTATTQPMVATRQKAGEWGGLVVPLLAADTVAGCTPLIIEPSIGGRLHRQPRTGGLRRQVFTVEPE